MPGEEFILQSPTPVTLAVVGVAYLIMLFSGTITALVLIFRALKSPVSWSERIEWLRARPWGWREGLAFAGLIGLLIVLGWGLTALQDNPNEGTLLIIQGLTLDLAGLGGMFGLLLLRGWSWKEAFGLGPLSAKLIQYGFVFYIVILPFLLISSLIYQGILSFNGYPPSLQDIALLLSGDYPAWVRFLMVTFAVAVAPVFEECLFRGMLFPMAVRKFGLGAGTFLISFLFAAIHAHLSSFIPLLIIAAGFSLAYLYTRSLWVPIIMHGLFNGVNLAILIAIHP